MTQELSEAEAVRVAAFGLDKPEFTRADWEAFSARKYEWEDVDYSDKEIAVAVELARLFQSPTPTAEQVSYFMEDAENVADDLPDGPWDTAKSFMPNARFMWLVKFDDVLLGLEDDEGAELVTLGKLPLAWDRGESRS